MLPWIRQHQPRLLWASIILYNNWVLAIALNPHATFAGSTTSELSVSGEPWAWLFRLSDLAAGILFLLGATYIAKLGRTRTQQSLLLFAMYVLGLSTIIEIIFPLDCAPAVNQICSLTENLGVYSWQDKLHIIESAITYGLIAILPLTVMLARHLRGNVKKLQRTSWVLAVFMLIWGVETWYRFAHHAASYGLEQRAFLILFTIWFVLALRCRETKV